MQKNNQRKKLFLKFLNFYWLRPEKALLHTFRSEKYMKTFKYFKSPSLDVSCGDGVYSFFHMVVNYRQNVINIKV